MASTHWVVVVPTPGYTSAIYAGAAIKGALSESFLLSLDSGHSGAGASIVHRPIEEFGWRGLALPLLQRKPAPFWAGLILGIIWAAWHIPAFLLSGTP